MLKNTIFVFLFLIGCISFAQSVIYGKITDDSGSPVGNADVFIDGTDYYYMTMDDGMYELEVEPGEYIVTYSVFGFDEKKINVIITTNERIEHNVSLAVQETGTVGLETIVVTATSNDPANESAALQEQKKADVIIETISGGEISRKGISDAGEAVKSIVGITKEEGSSNVYVRGLSDRYQNTTFNGLPLPSNNVEKKNIDLDIFNASIIEGVSVSKTYSPHFSGDYAAGNVNINSKSQTSRNTLELGASAGFNTQALGEDWVRNEGTGFWGYYGRYAHNPFAIVAQHEVDPVDGGSPINTGFNGAFGKSFRFDNDAKLNVLLTGSFGNNFTLFKGLEGAYTQSKDTYFNEVNKYNYSTSTTGLASVLYEPNKTNTFEYVSLFINNSSDEIGQFGLNGEGYDPDLADDGGYVKLNYEFQQTRLFVNQLMGKHEITDNLDIDWGVGYNVVLSNIPDRKRFTFRDYNTAEPFFNDFVKFDNQRFFQDINDEEIGTRFEFVYHLGDKAERGDDRTKLKLGYNSRFKYRDFESIRYGMYNITDDFQIDNLDAIFNLENFLNNFDNQIPNQFDYYVLNPIYDDLGPNMDPRTNLPGRPDGVYNAKMINQAPYAAIEFRPNEKWLIIPGLRYENYDQYIKYNVVNTPEGEAELNEWKFLPSLNIKFSPNPDMNLRLAGSKTVSIPEFKEIAPFVNEGVTQFTGGNPELIDPSTITTGSTGEKLSDIYNFDAKVEWFPNRGELISLAFFGKIIKAPVNLVQAQDAANNFRYFRTGEKATVLGAELEFEKELAQMGSGDLSVGGNLAYTHTEQDLFSSIVGQFSTDFNRDSDQLQGASPFIANLDLSYDADYGNYETTFTVAGNYFSDRIFALGSTGNGNQIEKGIPTLNVIWINKFGKHFEANLSAKNLLNPEVEIIKENTNDGDVPLQSYKKGVGLGLSLKYAF